MIKLEIDGKQLEVKPGTMIIEAADNAAIPIPRFCYHKKLSIAANCRMCLVEVVKAPKPLPACATPVTEGMVVHTKSAVALMAQRSVMEFLLINHPLDCPVCDQGGECELQDLSMGYGKDISRFNRGKRSVKDENIGPLIATGMTRCIHCTRCVRFGEEIAGFKELGAVNRGEHLEIRSFLNSSIDSELSGNMIDVCPVGALTSKPYRFSARTWELQQRPSIAPHDCVGSNINVHSLRNNIKRVVPCENELINEVWLSDRDRFSYEGLNHAEKLLHPMVRENGVLVQSSWEKALNCAAEYIKAQVDLNPNDLITLLSPSSTVEEGYLLQKITRELGSDNVDFRLKNNNNLADLFSDNIAVKLADLEQADSFLIFGAVSFHGPVRDGKGWDQDAMDTRLKGVGPRGRRSWRPAGRSKGGVVMRKVELQQRNIVVGSLL
jgi:NADH-quinone oxidoreductase subunit G